MRTTWRAFEEFWITIMRDEPMALVSFKRLDNGKTFGLMANADELRALADEFTKAAEIIEQRKESA